ncbi:NUDIX hydrolase [Peribacillus asahii]|uniref:NUDIX hydrolase n=1 Tax=Peribacillus asahii TaxID=228899 RepID=UPI003813CD32
MGYIEDLRKLVGNTPLILNSSGVILINEKEEILLVFRKDTDNWGLIGGYMEIGETIEDTLRREVREELNTTIESLKFYGVFSGHEFYHEYPNGDKVYSVISVFEANNLDGDIKMDNEEISKFKFFSKDNLPDNMTKVTKILLEKYLR